MMNDDMEEDKMKSHRELEAYDEFFLAYIRIEAGHDAL
jgi:hypothetical protein